LARSQAGGSSCAEGLFGPLVGGFWSSWQIPFPRPGGLATPMGPTARWWPEQQGGCLGGRPPSSSHRPEILDADAEEGAHDSCD